MVNLGELVEHPEKYTGQKSFLGVGIGTDGIPIDLLRVHFLGNLIENYQILVADEFFSKRISGDSGLNDLDLNHAFGKYMSAFDLFQKVWPNNSKLIVCSDFMNEKEYHDVSGEVREELIRLNLWKKLEEIKTEVAEAKEFRRNFAHQELSVIEFLRRLGTTLKAGPHSEQKYDRVMAQLAPEMDFVYLHTAHALSRDEKEPSPYTINNLTSIPNRRILISDEPDTVEEKLKLGSIEALKYFAKLGSLAGRLQGKACLDSEGINYLNEEELRDIAQAYVLDNIIAPLKRASGISVYRKTNMRKIYDQTFDAVKVKFKNRNPDLNFVRSELNILTNQLLFLISQRINQGFDTEIYNIGYPNLSRAGVLLQIPEELFKPFLTKYFQGRKEGQLNEGLDLEIMSLLQRRLLVGFYVALAKLGMNKSVFDGEREKIVLEQIVERAQAHKLNPESTLKAFQFLMDKTKELQEIVISRYELDFEK